MTCEVNDRRRLITPTRGNLQNGHVHVTQNHDLNEGDVIAIERLDQFDYRVYPIPNKRQASAPKAVSEVVEVGEQGLLFPDALGGNGQKNQSRFGDTAFTRNRDEPLHRWVPWIAGFSGAFVDEVLDSADLVGGPDTTILDPFAGVGTTLVEGLKRGHNVVGFEINPYAALACEVKLSALNCRLKPLSDAIDQLADLRDRLLRDKMLPKSKSPSNFRSRIAFFSQEIERDVLLLLDFIAEQKNTFVRKALNVALGSVMVSFSNYSYEPSLSTRSAAGKGPITHADVFGVFRAKLAEIEADIKYFRQHMKRFAKRPDARVYQCSYLHDTELLSPHSVDAIVTSPPYLNNYHYIRNTRPQLYWLGLVDGNGDLKKLEEENFGRFWQTVRNGPAVELSFELPELRQVLAAIRGRNSDRGVYGGVGWANYAATYFNDCDKFFRVTRRIMKPGGLVVVVIGNNIVQGVHVETDRFLAQIAELHGFKVAGMHEVRKKRTGSSIVNSSVRAGTAAKKTPLYETAVELRAPL